MLSPEHVVARRREGRLVLSPLKGKRRERAERLAEDYLAVARENVGATRERFEAEADEVLIEGADQKLAMGIRKLVEDGCEFTEPEGTSPRELRSQLFVAAAQARRAEAAHFDADAFLEEFSQGLGLTAAQVKEALYADLRGAHRLVRAPSTGKGSLLNRYDLAQRQAVLLRAVRVIAYVQCATAQGYRQLFRALKFRRLLYQISAHAEGGYRIELDGPFSLFESVTKYGLHLALALPELERCDSVRWEAELRWGKGRERLRFEHEGTPGASGTRQEAAPLPDGISSLKQGFDALGTDWEIRAADAIVDLPGVGLCVPDLEFYREKDQRRVLFELLGFWSRDAVWKRLELVQAGLPTPMLFAASERLRVSEALLDGHESAGLVTFKGVLRPKAVLQRLNELADSPVAGPPADRKLP